MTVINNGLTTLKVISLGTTEIAKNKRQYKKLTLAKQTQVGTKTFLSNVSATRLVWDDFTDEQGKTFKGDLLFNTAEIGSEVLGDIVRVNTTSYELSGRPCNSYTGVLFEHEELYSTFNKQLKQNLCVCLDDEGNRTAEIPKQSSITT